ncbi:hypothetical protein Bca52824_008681, partial [Brassica carinata]
MNLMLGRSNDVMNDGLKGLHVFAFEQFGRTHGQIRHLLLNTGWHDYVCVVDFVPVQLQNLLFTNLGGERRFASIVAKRLETLGALTQEIAGKAGPSLSAYNYDSNFGKKSLMVMYRGIMEQVLIKPRVLQYLGPVIMDRAALIAVGIVRDSVLANGKDTGKLSGRIIDSDMHDVGRFLNRLLGLPPDIQNRLFELFTSILDVLVHNARIEGTFDSGIVDMKANSVELLTTPK